MPSAPALNREQKRDRKRKKPEKDFTSNTSNRQTGDQGPKSGPSPLKQTGVYVTNLPPTATKEKIAEVFGKAGVLLIDDEGQKRVKMYYDENGKFKGEALVLYFKEGSVDLAIRLLDDTELEYGAGVGNMNVKVAEYTKPDPETASKQDTSIGDTEGSAPVKEKKKLGREEKLKMSKRIKTLQKYVLFVLLEDLD